ATAPIPMAIKRGSKVTIGFAGPQVQGVAPVAVSAPSDPATVAIALAPKSQNGLHGWPVSLALSDLDERVEQEPNNDAAKAYVIEVQHLNYLSGPSEAYRLTVTPIVPDFDLALGIDRYDVAPGSVAAVTLQATRRGYTGPIDLRLHGAPAGVSGSTTLAAGE